MPINKKDETNRKLKKLADKSRHLKQTGRFRQYVDFYCAMKTNSDALTTPSSAVMVLYTIEIKNANSFSVKDIYLI